MKFNMDKPLSEWTLGEIQQYCNKEITYFDCKFTGVCKFTGICFDNASDWDLTEESREPASPERRGRWEEKKYIVFDLEKTAFRCSECKTTWDAAAKYCPGCGAWMQTE